MSERLDVIKIDLDLETKQECLELLTERLKALDKWELLPLGMIERIELIKKNTFGAFIFLTKKTTPEFLIIFQSILGDDWKHTAITLHNLKSRQEFWNKLFNYSKRNVSGEYVTATIYDVTSEIIETINPDKVNRP